MRKRARKREDARRQTVGEIMQVLRAAGLLDGRGQMANINLEAEIYEKLEALCQSE